VAVGSTGGPCRTGHARRRALLLALLVAALTGCGAAAEGDDAVAVTVEDSAGVRIVTSSGGGWDPADAWALGSDPVVLGGEAATGDLWEVRGFARTPDGGAVAVSGGSREIHVFDESGVRVLAFGREGEGPGELMFPGSMVLVPPDTVLLLDQLEHEVFLLDGTWMGAEPGGLVARDAFGPATALQPLWVATDHALVGRVLRRSNQQAPTPTGVYRPPSEMAVLPSGEAPVLLGDRGGIEQERVELGGGTRNVVAPFARSTVAAVSPWPEPRVLLSDNERYDVEIFDTSGRLLSRIRRDVEPVVVRDEWVEAWKEAQRGMTWTRGQLDQLEVLWNHMTIRSTLPSLEGAALDSLGHLWVQRPDSLPRRPVTFDVFEPEGGFLGEVVVPAGLRWLPMPRIGADYFMGLWTDELDVETVRIYSLDRGR
jgi:hypothetical protein